MPLAFGSSSSVDNSGAQTILITVTAPSGTANGDVLWASVCSLANSGGSITPPSGWTLLTSGQEASGQSKQWTYYKVAGSGEPASYTWTLVSADYNCGVIHRYTGGNATQPDVAASNNTGTSNPATATGVTVATANAWIVVGITDGAPVSGSGTTPAGMTSRVTIAGAYAATYDQGPLSTGATGTRTSTLSGTNLAWDAEMVAIRPAGAAAAGTLFKKRLNTLLRM